MIPLMLLGIFITNISGTSLPWNTTLPINATTNTTDVSQIPRVVTQNIPWFFPFLTFVLFIATDYVIAIKKGVDLKNNLFACSVSFTALMYAEVSGGIAGSAYAYIFAFLMVLLILIMTLFQSRNG